jgi:hypothetical protein
LSSQSFDRHRQSPLFVCAGSPGHPSDDSCPGKRPVSIADVIRCVIAFPLATQIGFTVMTTHAFHSTTTWNRLFPAGRPIVTLADRMSVYIKNPLVTQLLIHTKSPGLLRLVIAFCKSRTAWYPRRNAAVGSHSFVHCRKSFLTTKVLPPQRKTRQGTQTVMMLSTRQWILSLLVALAANLVAADQDIGLCCLCSGCSPPVSGRGNMAVSSNVSVCLHTSLSRSLSYSWTCIPHVLSIVFQNRASHVTN